MSGFKDDEYWKIAISEELFKKLKYDLRFHAILRLCRCVNALTSFTVSMLEADKLDYPESKRQRINSFLYSCSVLHEGQKMIRDLGKYFHDLDTYKNGFADFQKKLKRYKSTQKY